MSKELDGFGSDIPARLCGDLIQDLLNAGCTARFERSGGSGGDGYITLKNQEGKTCRVTLTRECLDDYVDANERTQHRKLLVMAETMNKIAESSEEEAIIRSGDLPNQ